MQPRGRQWVRYPKLKAFSIKRCSTSMIRMKRWGERGSPRRSPRLFEMRPPGVPLRRMRVEAIARKAQIHAIILSPKPSFLRISTRNDQSTVLKALVMSSLSSTTRVEEL